MDRTTQKARAERLAALHDRSKLLVLPNAWDVISARLVEHAGFPAIATSSAAVAASLGQLDGERIARGEMLEVVGRIARAVQVPVTADLEAGYGSAADTAKAALEVGAVGLNCEDGTHDETKIVDTAIHVDRIGSMREAAASFGVPLVINARIDVFIAQIGVPESRLDAAIARGRAYRAAGADCLFLPAVKDLATLSSFVRAVDAPVNAFIVPGSPSLAELQRAGLARASFGPWLQRLALTTVSRFVTELHEQGTFSALSGDLLSGADFGRLLAKQ